MSNIVLGKGKTVAYRDKSWRIVDAWRDANGKVVCELQGETEVDHCTAWGDDVTPEAGDQSLAGLRAVADAISARAREIKPLDLVVLLSGGPQMVVERIDAGGVAGPIRCWWMDHGGDLHIASFPASLLRLVD